MDKLRQMLADDMKSDSKGSDDSNDGLDIPTGVYGTHDGRLVVMAKSIKRALEKASMAYDDSIMNLDYEIIDPGKKGYFGFGSQPCKIIVGRSDIKFGDLEPVQQNYGADSFSSFDADEASHAAVLQQDVNGYVKVVVRKTGIFISVFPPVGSGSEATMDDADRALMSKSIQNYDLELITKLVKEKTGEPLKIGDWHPNKDFDSTATVTIDSDQMKAFVTVRPPEKYGRVLEVADVLSFLDNFGVRYGAMEDAIKEMLENESYRIPVLVAKGKPVVEGEDAVINYNFRVDDETVTLHEKDGKVDFHNLDKVQNVIVGQVLATKVEATIGEAGRLVTGERINAQSGKDTQLIAGKNCLLSEDGLELTSEINGRVYFHNKKVNVEPVYEVDGSVNLETGNIVFLGTVIVNGSVEDGFSIKAAGDVEVFGSVSKAVIEAEGDVKIRQGVMGRDEGIIKAGGSVSAKFLEHVTVTAGNDVTVTQAIMHSIVDAGSRVLCVGTKKAQIVGGRIRAHKEVNAKEIGSKASTETEIEVGIDPQSREKLTELEEEKRTSNDRIGEIVKEIITLQNQKGPGGFLPEEKEERLQNDIVEKGELEERAKEVGEEIGELRVYLNMLESSGKVCASKMVYPGVHIIVKDAPFEVKDNFKFVTFSQEGGEIKINPYEEYEGMEKGRGGRIS